MRPSLLALVGAFALALPACGTPAPTLEVAPATSGDLALTVTAVGTLAAEDEVQVGTELSGTVLEVGVEVNDAVVAGQLLARLDPVPFALAVDEGEAAVAAARAAVRTAEVGLASAESELGRTERLHERGAATSVQLDHARTQRDLQAAQLDAARAQWLQARSALARARDHLDATELHSPIDGVVLRRAVEPGQTVVSALSAPTLFTVGGDTSALVAEVDIDEADVARVREGQAVSCSVPAWPAREFMGVVERVDLAPDPRSPVVVYVARVRVDNPDGALRTGMTVTASIETDRFEDAVLVPSAALRFAPEGASPGGRVYVDEGGEPRALPVEVLGEDGLLAAVSGVPIGAPVVTGVQR
ncbi:MAG: efflux RND transporter periplasmic adaptor subunit [Myxococcales bacterium]|nr:efflux RND transporter periplasmic adaptor subunit [Myxococcales bacterium]